MQRARLWTLSVLVLGFVLLGIGGVGPVSLRLVRPAAAVAWPVSTAALLAEVVTGGASASDEFVEITPKSLRLRKKILQFNRRKKSSMATVEEG